MLEFNVNNMPLNELMDDNFNYKKQQEIISKCVSVFNEYGLTKEEVKSLLERLNKI